MRIIFTALLSIIFLALSSSDQWEEDFFPELQGLKKLELKVYDSQNLYDYINGAADSYLQYNFQKLTVMRYEGSNKEMLKIEVYEHSSENNAFGIFSNEKPYESQWLPIGTIAYMEDGILNCLQGKCYIKLFSYKMIDKQEIIKEAASKVAASFPGSGKVPIISTLFPVNGKIINSERFVNKNFLGYESLSEAFTAEYEEGDFYFNLFIIQKTSTRECRSMLNSYLTSIKKSSADLKEGKILIEDPYQGKLNIIWQGSLIYGVLNLNDDILSDKYLELLNKSVEENL